ncbi:LOW QUALITY PROTEIN: hypothetical protein CFOL_v3_11487, partial [Cephalotus follicularis]
QSLPTYSMSVFKLPNCLCAELNSITSNFWWQKNGERRMHWASWRRLSLPNGEYWGGLGFLDLQAFNLAMLAKQGWRLINDEDPQCSRVLRARYFRQGNFLDAPREYNPSFTWSSIFEAKEMLKKGKWRIGNGISTEIWKDNWLPEVDEPPKPTSSNTLDQEARVCQLIDWERGGWNQFLVRRCVDEAAVRCILSIPLSNRLCFDKLIWSKHSSGCYMVKSGYHMAYDILYGEPDAIGAIPANLWKWIWGIQLPQKTKLFGWKCCTGILPVMEAVA